MGIRQAILVQYFVWLGRALRGDMDVLLFSCRLSNQVSLGYTLKLNFWATLLGLAVAFLSEFLYQAANLDRLYCQCPRSSGDVDAWILAVVGADYRLCCQARLVPYRGTGTWAHYVLPAAARV